MTDDKKPRELVAIIKIGPCGAGHVHVVLSRADDSEIATAILSVDEAVVHAESVSLAAEVARIALENVPGIVGGDAEPCTTKH